MLENPSIRRYSPARAVTMRPVRTISRKDSHHVTDLVLRILRDYTPSVTSNTDEMMR